LQLARRSATIAPVANGFGVGYAVAGALSLALVGCGGSGALSDGGNSALTPFPGCLPPCLESALISCVGNATACSAPSTYFSICWDTGARAATTYSILDGGVEAENLAIYSPDGSLCLTQIAVPGANGVSQLSYYDANGTLIASTSDDPNAPMGSVLNCDGKTYVMKDTTASASCSDNAPILLGHACGGTLLQCPL
jgi:hypothetical protein